MKNSIYATKKADVAIGSGSSDAIKGNIYFTKNLDQFKLINGNRPVNSSQVALLAKGMEKYGVLQSPIIVNQDGEIYDGQHRYSAAKITGLGIYYVVVDGYDLEQMRSLNLTQRNWSLLDYHRSFMSVGKEEYIKLDNFWKRSEGFTLRQCIYLCSNSSSVDGVSFKQGEFVCKDVSIAQDWADKLVSLKPYFEGFNGSNFVKVMIYMFKHPNFDFNRFFRIVKSRRVTLHRCASLTQYKDLIETIYNYRYTKKVNLRFVP